MVPYLAGLGGNLLKYANVANDLELNDKLVKSYVEILELMFILRRVPAYLKNRAKRQAVRMPKIHYIDTGLSCHLLGIHDEGQLLRTRHYGSLLESLIYMECCKQAGWAREPISVYQFRNHRQRKVDIVLERSDARIIGIEIKASASIGNRDFQGLVALAEFAGDAFERGVVFYTGKDVLPFKQGGLTFHALPIGLLLDGASGVTKT